MIAWTNYLIIFKMYKSAESVFSDEVHNVVFYPPEFLSGHETSEMPTQEI
jgi:hypothetical protein